MSISDDAIIYYEAAQTTVDMTELTDSGDQTFFQSADNFWSNKSGYKATVLPDGVITGFAITTDAVADQVNVAAGTLYQAGVKRTVAAETGLSVPRPAVSDYQIISVTVNSSQAVVIVEGDEHTAFSTTRGAAGGPPLIPVGSVELGQIRYSSGTSAAILSTEIKQVQGSSIERFDYPLWEQKRVNVENGVLGYAGIEFLSALPEIHVGVLPKAVYAEYSTPEFAELVDATDFVPAETTHTTTSTQVYGRTIGGSSETLNQSTFTFYPEDGISDAVFKEKNSDLLFKFKQNRLDDPYLIQQGKFGVSRSFPSSDLVSVSATVSSSEAAAEVTVF